MTANPFATDYAGPEPTLAPVVSAEPEVAWAERVPLITEPGIYPDILPSQYFQEPCICPALTNSGIKMLAPVGAAPAKFAYHHPAIGQLPEERNKTVALYMGSLVHRLALDKGDDYAVSPFRDFRTGDARAWKKTQADLGKIVVTEKQFEEAREMAGIIRAKIKEATAGYPYQTEVVIAWNEDVELDGGEVQRIWCRSMLDVWCPDLVLALDVKTAIDCTDDALGKWFNKGYAQQECFYLRGIQRVTGKTKEPRMGFLFVEKEPPYLSRPGFSTDAYRQGKWLDIEAAMKTFATCLRDGVWPGYEPFEALPSLWQVSQWSELEEGDISI